MDAPTILLLAGEASGDHHGAAVAHELKRRWPSARLLGLGGALMKRAGVELLAGLDELAVMGFAEVVPRLRFFWRLKRRLVSLLESGDVDLVLPIDYPGFNMRLAREAHDRRIPVLYYIAPQVWAWRRGRAAKLARVTDRIAVILPFETEIFEAAGASVRFVGHPLLERPDDVPSRQDFCHRWGLDPERRLLAVLPGSRRQEIDRHLGPFVQAAELVAKEYRDVVPVLARAPGLSATAFHGSGLPMVTDSRGLLRHARAAIVKSGTSTLEAALEGVPFVVAYRTSGLTWAIVRRVIRVEHVALANLVVGEGVVPELLQEHATPARIAAAVLPLLGDGPERSVQVAALARVRGALGSPGAAARVGELAAELLEARG